MRPAEVIRLKQTEIWLREGTAVPGTVPLVRCVREEGPCPGAILLVLSQALPHLLGALLGDLRPAMSSCQFFRV